MNSSRIRVTPVIDYTGGLTKILEETPGTYTSGHKPLYKTRVYSDVYIRRKRHKPKRPRHTKVTESTQTLGVPLYREKFLDDFILSFTYSHNFFLPQICGQFHFSLVLTRTVFCVSG